MQYKSTEYLRRRRAALVKKLTQLMSTVVRGSLIERYKRCGKPNCRCAQGKGHGPKYYLSVSQTGGKPTMKYIAQKNKEVFQNCIQNFLIAKKLFGEISEINTELFSRIQP